MNKIEQQVFEILRTAGINPSSSRTILEKLKPLLRHEPTPVEIAAQELADDLTFGEIARLKSELEAYKRRDKIIAFPSAPEDTLIELCNAVQKLKTIPLHKIKSALIEDVANNETIDSTTAIYNATIILSSIGKELIERDVHDTIAEKS